LLLALSFNGNAEIGNITKGRKLMIHRFFKLALEAGYALPTVTRGIQNKVTYIHALTTGIKITGPCHNGEPVGEAGY
jgi:hypothetical protein